MNSRIQYPQSPPFFSSFDPIQRVSRGSLIAKIAILSLALSRKIADSGQLPPSDLQGKSSCSRPGFHSLIGQLRYLQRTQPLYFEPCEQLIQDYVELQSSYPQEPSTLQLQHTVTKTEELIQTVLGDHDGRRNPPSLSQQTCMHLQALFNTHNRDEIETISNQLFHRPSPHVLNQLCSLGEKLQPYGQIVFDIVMKGYSSFPSTPSTQKNLSQVEQVAFDLMLVIKHDVPPTKIPHDSYGAYQWLATKARSIAQTIAEQNRSLVQQKKICSILEQYYNHPGLQERLEKCSSPERHTIYMDILKSHNLRPATEENHLAYVQESLHRWIMDELTQTEFSPSTQIDATARFEENLAAVLKARAYMIELRALVTQIEKACCPLPTKIERLLRPPLSHKKWGNLIDFLNQQFSLSLPKELSQKNQEQTIPQIISCIRTVREAELHEKQLAFETQRMALQKHTATASQITSQLYSSSSAHEVEQILASIQQSHSLSFTLHHELMILFPLHKERLLPFQALLTNAFACLAAGVYLTPEEFEKSLAEIILLTDQNLSLDTMPKGDFVLQSEWICQAVKTFISSMHQEHRASLNHLKEGNIFNQLRLHQVYLPRFVATLLLTQDGRINYGLAPHIYSLFPLKEERNNFHKQIVQIVDQLRDSPSLVLRLERIAAPPQNSCGETVVRLSLDMSKTAAITLKETRAAVLGTLLTWTRQEELNDCSVTGPYQLALEQATYQLTEDFAELLSSGTIKRLYIASPYRLEGLLWPALFASKETIPTLPAQALINLYDFPPFKKALDELALISKEEWARIVQKSSSPYDLRTIFSSINSDPHTIQKALYILESHQEPPLKRLWLNTIGGINSLVTERMEFPKADYYFHSMKRICDRVAKQLDRRAQPLLDERPIVARFQTLRICCVPQGPNIQYDTDLSWVFFQEQDGEKVPLTKERFNNFLQDFFIARYPHIPLALVQKQDWYREFLHEFEAFQSGTINGIVGIGGGGMALQDIFEQKIYPSMMSGSAPSKPESFIRYAREQMNQVKVNKEAFILGANVGHIFRLLLNHKSVVSCCIDPTKALDEQERFANRFCALRRPYKEWLTIALDNNLTAWNVTLTPTEAERMGTVQEFVTLLSYKAPLTLYRDLSEEELLPLRFLLHECKTQQRTAALHFADSNYRSDTPCARHYGFLYNPFQPGGSWLTVLLDENDDPSSLELIEKNPFLDTPQDSLVRRALYEAREIEISHQIRKTRKQLNQIKRDFTRLFPLQQKQLPTSSLIAPMPRLGSGRPISMAPRKNFHALPTDLADLHRPFQEISLRVQQVLDTLQSIDPLGYKKILEATQASPHEAVSPFDKTLRILMTTGFPTKS